MTLTLIGFLDKQRKLKEYHTQLVGKLLQRALLSQYHICAELLLEIHRGEIQKSHQTDRIYLIFPGRTTLALTGNRLRNVIDAPVLEKGLRLVLHLHDDVFTLVGLTIDVVYQRPVFLKQSRLFLVEEGEVDDMFLALEQTVEEVEQQRFGQFLTEDSLETYIGKRINVFDHITNFDTKIVQTSEISKQKIVFLLLYFRV